MKLKEMATGVVPALALILGGALVFSVACGSTPEPLQSGGAIAPTVPPAVSINALMVSSIDHAAHAIWDAGAKPPKTDDDWLELDYHAIQLAALGTLVSVGGTGPADPGCACPTGSAILSSSPTLALPPARQRKPGTARPSRRLATRL